jgi:site-specific DNA-methyltransferase (adenine-specific)
MTIIKKAPRNKTLELTKAELKLYKKSLKKIRANVTVSDIVNHTIYDDFFNIHSRMPNDFIDLLFLDPPYNLNKKFNSVKFKSVSVESYSEWIECIIKKIYPMLKKSASVYFCGDWLSSASIYPVLEKYFYVKNRITWEREKGRGSKSNWKNNVEDIWYCTVSKYYTFNLDDVKIKRKVIAPYRLNNGVPKDWKEENNGKYRITHPSNIWTDISIPFWSMAENTDHPTQKPEKLLAKIILASSNEGDVVFDPFLGSGTTSVVAKKLNRKYIGIEIDEIYACMAEKRLSIAEHNKSIQGYEDGIFWERNTLTERKNLNKNKTN